MPQKSKTTQQKAAGIALAHAFHHHDTTSDFPDAEMNTTTPEISPSPNANLTRDLDNEDINEGITLEGPRDSPLGLEGSWDLSEVKIDCRYAEFEGEDEQGYVREGEELTSVYLTL